jgi:predicted acylesterase/phospholipase RssA
MSEKSVHLLCSSGGVRCFSYIGAYRALTEAGYTISGVSASSMGSVIGMLICCGMQADEIEEKVLQFPISTYLKKRFCFKWQAFFQPPFAMYHPPDYHKLLIDFTGTDSILEELQIPYSTLALDIRKQELLSFSKESHPEMRASELLGIATAIPPIFPAVEKGKRLLVDAGIATESPGWVAFAECMGNPVVVLKCANMVSSTGQNTFDKFLANMIQSAASGNDNFSLQQMPNTFSVEINCGNVKAEDFGISNKGIEDLIMSGEKAMQQTLSLCSGDLRKFLRVENIASQRKNMNANDKARERSIRLLQKYRKQTEEHHQVFISYSHKDVEWFDKLQSLLTPVEAFHSIKVWDDKEIEPGEFWHESISNALA